MGEYARVAAHYLDADSPHQVVAFAVDRERMEADELAGRAVVPFDELAERHPPAEHELLVAVGYAQVNKARAEIFERCASLGYSFISHVSSRSSRAEDVAVGRNSVVFDGCILEPGATIGDDSVLWSGVAVGHDTTVGDHCFLAPRAAVAGGCELGDYCFVGINATIGPGVKLGPECVVGAGVTVLADAERGAVFPAQAAEPAAKKSWELRRI